MVPFVKLTDVSGQELFVRADAVTSVFVFDNCTALTVVGAREMHAVDESMEKVMSLLDQALAGTL